MEAMYEAMAGSPITTLTADISDTDLDWPVDNPDALPPAPNLVTIYDNDSFETVKYTDKNESTITVDSRALQGVARTWSAGTNVSRLITAFDHNRFKENIEANLSEINTITGVASGWADSRIVEHNLDVSDPSNGYYVRWENGLQVCWSPIFENVPVTTRKDEHGYSTEANDRPKWYFPAVFNAKPFCNASVTEKGYPWAKTLNQNKEGVDIMALSNQGNLDHEVNISAFAIGRWK